MTRSFRHPCGCRSTDSHWIEMCAACKAEHDERHLRAAAERRERQALPQTEPQPVSA